MKPKLGMSMARSVRGGTSISQALGKPAPPSAAVEAQRAASALALVASTHGATLLKSEEALTHRLFYSVSAMMNYAEITEVLSSALLSVGTEELISYLDRMDYENGNVLTYQQFQVLMMQLKKKYLDDLAIPDSEVAFVALGGQEDLDGNVSASELRRVCDTFKLTIDIKKLIEEHDEDGSGLMEFNEFDAMFKKVAASDPAPAPVAGGSSHALNTLTLPLALHPLSPERREDDGSGNETAAGKDGLSDGDAGTPTSPNNNAGAAGQQSSVGFVGRNVFEDIEYWGSHAPSILSRRKKHNNSAQQQQTKGRHSSQASRSKSIRSDRQSEAGSSMYRSVRQNESSSEMNSVDDSATNPSRGGKGSQSQGDEEPIRPSKPPRLPLWKTGREDQAKTARQELPKSDGSCFGGSARRWDFDTPFIPLPPARGAATPRPLRPHTRDGPVNIEALLSKLRKEDEEKMKKQREMEELSYPREDRLPPLSRGSNRGQQTSQHRQRTPRTEGHSSERQKRSEPEPAKEEKEKETESQQQEEQQQEQSQNRGGTATTTNSSARQPIPQPPGASQRRGAPQEKKGSKHPARWYSYNPFDPDESIPVAADPIEAAQRVKPRGGGKRKKATKKAKSGDSQTAKPTSADSKASGRNDQKDEGNSETESPARDRHSDYSDDDEHQPSPSETEKKQETKNGEAQTTSTEREAVEETKEEEQEAKDEVKSNRSDSRRSTPVGEERKTKSPDRSRTPTPTQTRTPDPEPGPTKKEAESTKDHEDSSAGEGQSDRKEEPTRSPAAEDDRKRTPTPPPAPAPATATPPKENIHSAEADQPKSEHQSSVPQSMAPAAEDKNSTSTPPPSSQPAAQEQPAKAAEQEEEPAWL
jgi:Ca2+-binding EF-hand superfamily protein